MATPDTLKSMAWFSRGDLESSSAAASACVHDHRVFFASCFYPSHTHSLSCLSCFIGRGEREKAEQQGSSSRALRAALAHRANV